MCEFCSGPNNYEHGRDQQDASFAGFFSSDAIDAAVRQANKNSRRSSSKRDVSRSGDADEEEVGEEDYDSDGT